MDAGYTRIPNTIDNVAHRLGSQRGFFGDGNVARTGSYDCDRANPLIRFVAANSDQPRRFVPLGVSHDISYLAKRAFVRASDEDVRGALGESLDDADDLCASLTTTKNDFRKTLSRRARVVYARKTDIFEMKVLDAVYGIFSFEFAAFVRVQEFGQFVQIHRQKHATKNHTKHFLCGSLRPSVISALKRLFKRRDRRGPQRTAGITASYRLWLVTCAASGGLVRFDRD